MQASVSAGAEPRQREDYGFKLCHANEIFKLSYPNEIG